MAQVDYFLKVDGIPGESKDAQHMGEIDVLSFSWGVTQTGTMAFGGGGGAGKAAFNDFHFSMPASKASPKFMLACASGEHIKQAVLTARKAGGKQEDFVCWKFTDLLVSSHQAIGDGQGVVPQDSITLNFAVVEMVYKQQNANGTTGTPVKTGYDLKANKKL